VTAVKATANGIREPRNETNPVTRAPVDCPLLSVIVCTKNRASKLRLTLESLRGAAERGTAPWELIVVDNGSSDSTAEVVRSFFDAGLLPGRLVLEPRPGTAVARNRGVAEARGQILASTDDDCVVDSGWLAAIEREFAADPTLDLLGGRVELYDSRDQPVTIRTSRERWTPTSPDRILMLSGCNLAFRRRLVDIVGGRDQDLGPGGRFRSGEDVDFLYRAWHAGARAVYAPDLLVYHNHGRRTDAEVDRLNRGYLFGRGAVYAKHVLGGDGVALKLVYWEVRWFLRALWHREPLGRSRRTTVRYLATLLVGFGSRALAGLYSGRA